MEGAVVGGGASVGAESPCSRHHGGRGSCCHCQVLSRAAGRKQQMVELVPEQRVKPKQRAAFGSPALFFGLTASAPPPPRRAQVLPEGLALLVFARRFLRLVAELKR